MGYLVLGILGEGVLLILEGDECEESTDYS